MAKICANAFLVKDFKIVVDNSRSHSICLDQPLGEGSDMGPTALELCAMSLAGCYATIFALTAKKMRMPLNGLDITLEAVKTEEEGTITKAKMNITAKADTPQDRIRRAHQLTVKNCPVGILFEKAGVKIEYNVQTEKQ
jgi:putative redox protein